MSAREKPIPYVCNDCGAGGVRLYRDYNTFIDHQTLRCTACVEVKSGSRVDPERPDSVGWYVAAVPSGTTFWGYTSVPAEGVSWWRALATRQPA